MHFLIHSTDFSNCQEALGMENGNITNDEISASSVHADNTGASRARLNFISSAGVSGGWVAATNDDNPALNITFSYPYTIVTGIATQGRQDEDQWVKEYRLRYSKPNGEKGEALKKVNNNMLGRYKVYIRAMWPIRPELNSFFFFISLYTSKIKIRGNVQNDIIWYIRNNPLYHD